MSEKKNSLKNISKRYHANMKALTKGLHERDIFGSLANGKNSYLRLDRLESSMFDRTWIDKIEDVIFDLGDIIANPRQNTKTEGHLVPVELARKTGSESIQHLASHTQYVKEVDDYGNVIPSKIITLMADDDIKTYENRFIATFVRRLVLFIEKRYEFISKFAELHDDHILYFKNQSFVDGATVEIETKIKVSHKSDDDMSLKSNAFVQKIKELRTYILYFYGSPFMKQLKTEKDVHNPILQTNIIRKNPKYHHCYEVYRFLEKYEHLGVNYRVDENYSIFTQDEINEINHTLFATYLTLSGHDQSKVTKASNKIYKPKVLTSLDDEIFTYGPLFEGPIEFARVDEPYQKYLDSKLKKDLPQHPTKKEKEYYADEYAARIANKEDLRQKNELIKRKEKEAKEFEKFAHKIEEEREKARLALLKQEKEIIKQEENDLLTAARNAIIAASLADKEEAMAEQAKAEEERLNNIEPAIILVPMSHPHQDPVTYDEAVLQIWPQAKDQPLPKREYAPVKEEPAVEQPPVVEEEPVIEEAPLVEETSVVEETPVVEASVEEAPAAEEPISEEVPETNEEPVVEEVPVVEEAPVIEETPVEEAPIEETPAVQEMPRVVEMSHPYEEPVNYDEATLQIWPQLKNAPTKKVAPQKEAKPKKEKPVTQKPVVEQPPVTEAVPEEQPVVEDKPAVEPKKALANKATPKAKPAAKKEPIEPAPVVEPVKESKPEPKPQKEAKKVEPQKEAEVPPKVVVKEVEKPVIAEVRKVPERRKIPGRFIVKTDQGYYISDNKYSIYKEDAKVFDDYNLAKDIKLTQGGKVIKLL